MIQRTRLNMARVHLHVEAWPDPVIDSDRARPEMDIRGDFLVARPRSIDYHSHTVRCQNDPQLPAVVVPPRTFPRRLREVLRGLVKVPHPAVVAKDFELLNRQRGQARPHEHWRRHCAENASLG